MINRNYDNIPKELTKLKQWVCFKAEEEKENPGHFVKRLINPYNGQWAKPNEPRDWAYFSIAKKMMNKYNYDGLAFCLTNLQGESLRNDIFCIDLDKVLFQPETTDFDTFEAFKIYEMFKDKTYIEYSMSGTGLHILGIGNLPNPCKYRKGCIEMYDKTRFMSLTGAKMEGSTNCLGQCEKELCEANLTYIGKLEQIDLGKVKRGEVSETDYELIEKIRNSKQGAKFSRLFDSGCDSGDDSADDFALCRILAFWTRNNEIQMDSIFRQSALMRPKWDKRHGQMTYGEMTIRNAIAGGNVVRREK